MENQVEEIKRKVNIVNIVGEHVALKKKGKNHVGLCPFHGEKTPSFMVNEELQIYKCFGCSEGGDVYKFLMEVEGLDFGEALEKLAGRAGVKLVRRAMEGKDPKRELIEVHCLAAEYYHYLLAAHPAGEVARKYLAERGIKERLIETFKLGYALPEWDGLVKYLGNKKGYKQEVLVAAGLATGGGGRLYDRFRGRVMFPLLDISGRVVGFSGRVLPARSDAALVGKPDHEEAKYINSPETEIYHKSKMLFGLTVARNEIRKKDRVVVVEGELDMISSFAAGISETVAVKGTAVTEQMLAILSRLTNNFILALDTDTAGEAAMKRLIEAAEKLELNIKMVEIIGGKDPDEIARKKPREWVEIVEKAVPVYEFFFNKAISRWGTGSVENVTKVVREVVPYLSKVENSVIREVWAKKLSERIGVDKQRVWEEIDKARFGSPARIPPGREALAGKPFVGGKTSNLDMQVTNILLSADENFAEKVKRVLFGMPLSGGSGKLVGIILEKGAVEGIEKLIKSLPHELSSLAQEAFMMEMEEMEEKTKLKLVTEWARRLVREERGRLSESIRKEEERGEGADLGILSEKLVKLNALERRLVIS